MRNGLLAAGILGFALGGFLDGILLHQILQWHHLLSLVPGVDLRAQILWDGWLHALMYVLAVLALGGLWFARHRITRRGMQGALLVGFGLWHVEDAVISHWLLGLHRIRMDSEFPLLWDLGWLAAFGVVPIILGVILLRRRPGCVVPEQINRIALLSVALGFWAMMPPADQPLTLVVFAAGAETPEAWIADLGGSVVWTDGDVVLADLPADRRMALYRQGALYVTGSGLPAGCFDWREA